MDTTERYKLSVRPVGSHDETVVYTPTEKACEFHASDAPNLLLHGPRGGGITTALRFDAHMRALVTPGFTYMLVCRDFPRLLRTHLTRVGQEMRLLDGTYVRSRCSAYYQNGSQGHYLACSTEAEIIFALAHSVDLVVIDGLTDFPGGLADKLATCARQFVRCGTNPLGEFSADVMTRYITKSITHDENPDYDPADYADIALSIGDNPHIDAVPFQARMSQLPADVRKGWLDGAWA